MKFLFTKAQVDHFLTTLLLADRVETAHDISRCKVGDRVLQITRSRGLTESEPSRIVTGMQLDWRGEITNKRRPPVFTKLRAAFNWLLPQRPLKLTDWTTIRFRVKVGDAAQLINAQYASNGGWEGWKNLKGPDRHLALRVVIGDYGAEVCDFLQDHYGLEVI